MSTTVIPPRTGKESRGKHKTIIGTGIGNALEWFDWGIFAVFSPFFATQFFNPANPVSAFLSTLAVFAVGMGSLSGSFDTSPLTSPKRTPGLSSRTAVTTSRTASNACPRISKPTPGFGRRSGCWAVSWPPSAGWTNSRHRNRAFAKSPRC